MSREARNSSMPALFRGKVLSAVSTIGVGCFFLVLMAAGAIAIHYHSAVGEIVGKNPPLTVTTDTIQVVPGYKVKQSFAGRLEAARETRLAFERGGLVLKVHVNEGDRIKAGDLIATLDTAQLKNRKEQLIAQRNELRAQIGLAEATFKRISSLKKKGWTPTQSFDEARFNVQQLKASLERISASIESVSIDLEKSGLKAPFAGTVSVRNIDEGSVVAAGAPILTLLEDMRKKIRVGVSVEASSALKPGEKYPFRIHGKKYNGVLLSKRPDLQTGTRTVTALFEITDAGRIPLGEIAELILERQVSVSGAWLPLTALHEGRKGLWTVYKVSTVDGRHHVRREAVEILYSSEGRVFARGTLAHGDKVIANGSSRIVSGQEVALESSR